MTRIVATALALSFLAVAPTSAQDRPLAISVGGAHVQYAAFAGDNSFSLRIPSAILGLSAPLSDHLAVGGGFGFGFSSTETATAASIGMHAEVPYRFNASHGRDGFYVAPRVGFFYWNADASGLGESTSQFHAGVAVGNAIPVLPHVSLTVSSAITYHFEGDYSDGVTLFAVLGVTLFTR